MAKFLNKKEQVYDLKLTSYGKYTLSIGAFEPSYYAFYDDNVLYDKTYSFPTSGSSDPFSQSAEPQNYIHKRIKEETVYLESLILFEEVEQATNNVGGYFFDVDITPQQETPRKDMFRFDRSIGDAYFSAENSQYAPAWKIIALEGLISGASPFDGVNDIKIPQIDMNLRYVKKVDYLSPGFAIDSFTSSLDATEGFAGGRSIVLDRADPTIYAEEVNTEVLTENFDIEVFEIVIGAPCTYASGSVQIKTQPANADYVMVPTFSTDVETFTFSTASANDFFRNNVTIGASIEATTENLYNVMKHVLDDASSLDASSGLVSHGIVTKGYAGVAYNGSTVISLTNFSTPCEAGNKTIKLSSGASSKIQTVGYQGAENSKEELKRKHFQTEIPQVVDGLMVSSRPSGVRISELTTGSVEYYFNIYADQQVDAAVACKGAEEFNKQSYYVNLDFDCDMESELEEAVYYDIYGRVTESEICPD